MLTTKTTNMTGVELIAKERQEQIEKHGRTLEYDTKSNQGRMIIRGVNALLGDSGDGIYGMFPRHWDKAITQKMFDKSYKERLIIAGALIAAEIDRIQANEV